MIFLLIFESSAKWSKHPFDSCLDVFNKAKPVELGVSGLISGIFPSDDLAQDRHSKFQEKPKPSHKYRYQECQARFPISNDIEGGKLQCKRTGCKLKCDHNGVLETGERKLDCIHEYHIGTTGKFRWRTADHKTHDSNIIGTCGICPDINFHGK